MKVCCAVPPMAQYEDGRLNFNVRHPSGIANAFKCVEHRIDETASGDGTATNPKCWRDSKAVVGK